MLVRGLESDTERKRERYIGRDEMEREFEWYCTVWHINHPSQWSSVACVMRCQCLFEDELGSEDLHAFVVCGMRRTRRGR